MRRLDDGPRRMEDEGLSGVCCGSGGTDAVRFVLELDAVSGLLGTRRSGLFDEVMGGGAEAGGDTGCTDPMDDTDASELADAIASLLIAVHVSSDRFRVAVAAMGDNGSFVDLCENDNVRGLSTRPGDFGAPPASFIDDCEGEFRSFLPSGIEKLHFLDGVLCVEPVAGVETFRELCLTGVEGSTGASCTGARSTSPPARLEDIFSSPLSDDGNAIETFA